ncbi:hypothetical protein V6N11_047836 [Hibiscus sabdariffa]|uniref:Uncharacterized protein n=2 Tax=Hibiscus sabdariffa TaxID=183260 RepID=A0ABR2P8N6_9ROSI
MAEADNAGTNGNHEVVLNVEAKANRNLLPPASDVAFTVPLMQKLMAEVLVTIAFATCKRFPLKQVTIVLYDSSPN